MSFNWKTVAVFVIIALIAEQACYRMGKRDADRWWEKRMADHEAISRTFCHHDACVICGTPWGVVGEWAEGGTVCHTDPKDRIAP